MSVLIPVNPVSGIGRVFPSVLSLETQTGKPPKSSGAKTKSAPLPSPPFPNPKPSAEDRDFGRFRPRSRSHKTSSRDGPGAQLREDRKERFAHLILQVYYGPESENGSPGKCYMVRKPTSSCLRPPQSGCKNGSVCLVPG